MMVELVVDERPGNPSSSLVRIDYRKTALRQQDKAAYGMPGENSGAWI